MTAGSALHGAVRGISPSAARSGSRLVVARRTARSAGLIGLLWGAVYALYVTGSASGYAAAYPTMAGRERLASSIGSNVGFTALLGVARHLDTVAGFTAWRTTGVLGLMGPVWALLLATRLTRGEEDAGRWELYLTGPTTRRRTTSQALLGLLAAPVVVVVVTAAATALDGRTRQVGFTPAQATFMALALTAPALWFLGLGALAAQLMPRRRQATILAAAALGAAFLMRLLADSNHALGWLRRATPLGWAELQHPLTGSDWRPLALLLTSAGILLIGAGWLAGTRDTGAGLLPATDSAPVHPLLLGGPVRFAIRQDRPIGLSWLAGVVVLAAIGGMVAESAAHATVGNGRFEKVLQRLGTHAAGAGAYLGVIFLVVAALTSFAATSLATAIRAEESDGLLDHLLTRPLGRQRWLAGRLLVAAGVLAGLGFASGVACWIGSIGHHTGIGIGDDLKAGLNTVPAALFVLGLGVCGFGLAPRLTGVLGYVAVSWSFLIELIGSTVRLSRWIVDTSLLTHVAPAPAVQPNWVTAAWLVALGCVLAGIGGYAFTRRDLTSG